MVLTGQKIAVGVTGGIAAYKTCELIRQLRKESAEVRVAMTEAAGKFVTALTFATLTETPVFNSLFDGNEESGVRHIELARWCNLFVLCPATANTIAKIAHGLADDIVSTSVMATHSPVIVCPAMNSGMWENPIVEQNLSRLRNLGYTVVEPEWGDLATSSEEQGWGRLAATNRIVETIRHTLFGTQKLSGKRMVVTAGPTREMIDPVRFLSNHSTGSMGFALAEAASLHGADVTLITGPTQLEASSRINCISITSAAEMEKAVTTAYAGADILIMAAAVADYKPQKLLSHKLKKQGDGFSLELTRTTDILEKLGKQKSGCIHVGFALETHNGMANATKKLHKKNLDMIVLNNPLDPGAGFGLETNRVSLLYADGTSEAIPLMKKRELADLLLDRVIAILKKTERRVKAV